MQVHSISITHLFLIVKNVPDFYQYKCGVMICRKYVGLALQPYVLQFYTAKLVIFNEFVKADFHRFAQFRTYCED